MAKKSVLLVDEDPRALRVLEVSLRNAGYNVASCRSGGDALDMAPHFEPDLLVSETQLPDLNGFELAVRMRQQPSLAEMPVIFVAADGSKGSRVRALEVGVEDFIPKPIYVRDVLGRIEVALQRRQRRGLTQRPAPVSRTRFAGVLQEMGLVDLLQTVDVSQKSGLITLSSGRRSGEIWFADGRVIDARAGAARGEAAVYRQLLWYTGTFEIDFRPVRREATVHVPMSTLLMEGMRRLDEWGRLTEQIPSMDAIFEVSETDLVARLSQMPKETHRILRHVEGRNSVADIIDAVEFDDLETLEILASLYFQCVLRLVETGGERSRATGARGVQRGSERSRRFRRTMRGVPAMSVEEATSASPAARERTEPKTEDRPQSRASSNAGATPTRATVPVGAMSIPEQSATLPEIGPDDREGTASATGQNEPKIKSRDGVESAPAGIEQRETASPGHGAEGGMSTTRKGRRRRRRKERIEAEARESMAPPSDAAHNVIQFPAQVKLAVGADTPPESDGAAGTEAAAPSEAAAAARGGSNTAEEPTDTTEAPAVVAEEAGPAEDSAPDEAESAAAAEEPSSDATEEGGAAAAEEDGAEAAEEDGAAASASEDESAGVDAKDDAIVESLLRDPDSEKPAAEAEAPSQRGRSKKKKARSKKARKREARRQSRSNRPPPAAAETSSGPSDEEERGRVMTSTSAEIRAVSMTGEHQEVAQGFFNSSAPPSAEDENWDDLEASVLSLDPVMKNAKRATFGILAFGVLLIGGYVAYHNFIMPAPAELSGGSPPELPSTVEPSEAESEDAVTATASAERAVEDDDSGGSAETAQPEPPSGADATETAEGELVDGEAATAEPSGAESVEAGDDGSDGLDGQELAEASAQPAAEEPVEPEAAPSGDQVDAPPVAEPPAGVDAAQLARDAYRQINRGRNQEAADLAAQAVAADPTIALAWLVLGAARSELRDRVGAREAFRSCVEQGQGREVRECRAMLR